MKSPSFLKLFLPFILLFSLLSDSYAQFVSVKGKEFILPDGSPVLLKGINLGNWLVPEGYMFKFKDVNSPRLIDELFSELIGPDGAREFWNQYMDNYITAEDIKYIKQLGFNSVRIPFNYRLFTVADNPEQLEGPGYEMLDRAVKWCAENNLYIILDMHCAPGGQTGDNIDDSYGYPFLFESSSSRNLTIKIWQKLADRYKDEPIIIGYDLLNEPIAHYFDKEKLNPYLEPFFKELTAAVREYDKNHIIFLGGAQWNSNFSVFGEPFDDKLAYTFHKYWTAPDQSVIQDYLDYSNKYNVPLYMGESGENTNEWINEFRIMLENNNVSWCFWPYKKMDSDRGIVSINRTAEFDSIIAYSAKPRHNYESIRNNRPSPEVVKKALSDFLQNCRLGFCKTNEGYLRALGLMQEGAEK